MDNSKVRLQHMNELQCSIAMLQLSVDVLIDVLVQGHLHVCQQYLTSC